jgi:catechol 2,3-dioxygenase-like lactoylglutathione lyase family enzyme
MPFHLRIARPVSDLTRATEMYCRGLGLRLLDEFKDHAGFDGVMLGEKDAGYHFEFTYCRSDPVVPSPTREDLLVLYIPRKEEWEHLCAAMSHAGFEAVTSSNPYWNTCGRTFEDPDGYRIVLQNAAPLIP